MTRTLAAALRVALLATLGFAAGLFWWALSIPPAGLRVAVCSAIVALVAFGIYRVEKVGARNEEVPPPD